MSAAYELKKAGFAPTVFEERDRVGGRIWSVQQGDYLMDVGTAVYLGTYFESIDLIHEVGLSDNFVEREASGAMMRDGKVHHFDYTTPVRTGLGTRALSWPSKIKALKLAALTFKTRKSLGYDTYDELAELDTETVREYCRRELNEELLQYAGRPLVSGTWVADDADTSVALMLWTIRNMLVDRVYNLTDGVQGLPNELAKRVDVRYEHPVSNVTDNGSGVEVTYRAGAGGSEQTDMFDSCVIATDRRTRGRDLPADGRQPPLSLRDGALPQARLDLPRALEAPAGSARPTRSARCARTPTRSQSSATTTRRRAAPRRARACSTVLLTHEYLERSEHLSDEQVMEYASRSASKYHRDICAASASRDAAGAGPSPCPTHRRRPLQADRRLQEEASTRRRACSSPPTSTASPASTAPSSPARRRPAESSARRLWVRRVRRS